MIEVEIPDKKMIIEFPDGMEQQEMMSIINEQVYGKVVETEIPTTITQKKPLGALLPKDIDLAPPDYPGGLPEDATGRTGKLQVPTLDQPPYTELGLPVGEPRVLGKAIDIPFIPGREIARAPGAFTEAEPFDIERKEASISDLGGKVGRELLQEGAATEALPHDITKREQIGDMGEAVGRLVAETGVEIATANIMIKALAGTIGSTARAIRESTAWRKLTIPERRLTIQSLDDVIKNNPNMSEGDILRRWGSYKDEALAKRAKPEAVPTGKPPIKAEAPLKEKPTLKVPTEKPTAKFEKGKLLTVKPGDLGKGLKLRAGESERVRTGIEKIKKDIVKTGKTKPISIDKTGFIVDGNHTYTALLELGVKDIPVWTGEQAGAAGRLKNVYPGLLIDVDIPKAIKVPELLKPKAPALTPEEAAIVKERGKGKIPTMLREQAPGVPKRSPEEAAEVAKIIKEAKAKPKEVRVEHEGILVGKEPVEKPVLKAPEAKIDKPPAVEGEKYHGKLEGVKTLLPEQLKPKNPREINTVKARIKNSGLSRNEWAKTIDLSEPVDVTLYSDGELIIQDGHHRYVAASILKKPLNVDLQVINFKSTKQKLTDFYGLDKAKKPTLKPPAKLKESKVTGKITGVPEEIKVTGKKEKIVTVEMPKKEAEALSPKEQKEYLLKEIDVAIEDHVNKLVKKEGITPEGARLVVEAKKTDRIRKPMGDKYTIKVPGDGEFELWGESLYDFKKRVKSKFPTSVVSKKFKPTFPDKINYATEIGKYKKLIGKKLQDIQTSDVSDYFGEAQTKRGKYGEKEPYIKDFSHFKNWLLNEDVTHAVKQEIKRLEGILAKPKAKPTLTKPTKPKTFASIGEPKKGPIPKEPKKPGKPIITAEQKKRTAKKKEVKEKQINIESAKEAKEQVRAMIIQRRKNLNLTAYETNLFVNEIEKITTKAQREVIPFIIEKTDIPKELKRPDIEKEYAKNKEMLTPLADQVQKYFDAGWQNMKKHIPDMSAEQIENYVTHIWDLNKKQKRPVTNWFITQNRFLKKRYIETLKEGIKLGFKPRTLDIGEIIQIHDSVMNRAIENKKFVDDLKRLRKDDVPLIERADKAPQDWVYFDHPALQRALVIPGEGVMGEKISPALASLLGEMGVAIGRRISPVVWGKPTRVAGQYRPGDPPEVRFQRFMSNKTIAHEIGHHLDEVLELGEGFLNRYKSELYAINRERIESLKGDTGKYGQAYAESKEEQIAEYFATLFTDADKAYKLAPNATVDALERLKKDGVLSQLINFDFEKSAKNLIEEQLNTMVKLPVKVHPDLEKPLKVIFDSRLDHAAIQAYEMVNGILKKSVLSLSLFHHAALGETGIATMGAAKTLNIYLNPIKIYNAMVKGEYDIYEKIPIAKDAIKHGLQVGATHDIPVQMIQDKLNALARKTKNIPLANKTTQLIATFNEKWDKALWNYLHDTLKLHAYESLITKIDPTKNVAKQKTEVAQFVNDTFGGQNWDMMMLSPKTVQIMTWSLLSADWTTSTIRQALSPTGIGAIHEETKGLRRKLGAYFWIKAGLYFGVGINMLNYTFRKWDEEKNPQYYKDKKMTFWDRTMAGNVIGKKTNLFVGRYGDGTERYIRWGKQFRELFEFFYDDTGFSPISAALKKIGGKLAPVIQQVSQIFTGVSPSGFKNDDVYGKKGWDKTYGIFKTLIKAPIPFASRNLLTKGREFNITDVAFPSSKGMTRYRSMELFKHAVMKNDERFLKEVYQDTLKNNLPAYTLFSAAITSLKAETSRELNSNRKEMADIKIALKKAAEIGDIQDIKRIESRLKRIIKETVDRKAGIKAYNLALIKLKQYKIETKPKKQTGKLVSPNKSKNGRLLKGD